LENKADFSTLDIYEKFEAGLPFCQTTIMNYELKIFEAAGGDEVIFMERLRDSLDTDAWFGLRDDESKLYKNLHTFPFSHKNFGFEQISKSALLAMGLLHCPGHDKKRAKVFYNLLQADSLDLDWIAANDKDFKPTFYLMMYLPTIYMFKIIN